MTTSAVGLGCMGFSQGYGPADDTESKAAIHAALDAGVRLLDTAMSYGQGANEHLVGGAVRTSGVDREAVAVASKVGIVRGERGVHLDGRPDHIAGYCEASLRRLGVEVIDLFYLHRVDPDVPIAETVGAMADLVRAGKVRYLGVSEVTPDQLEQAVSAAPITAVQFEWSLLWREPENELIPTARRLGVGLVPYSPLGRGLLTATLTTPDSIDASSFRAGDARFHGDDLAGNMTQIRALGALARQWGISTTQLCLAWLLAQGADVVPIPGSRRPARVVENAAAAAVHLDQGQLKQVRRAAPAAKWRGDRTSFAVPVTTRTTVEGEEAS